MKKDPSQTRILVVEDSLSAAMAIQRALREFDIVGVAHDAIKAKEMEKRLRPDVITMDIKIPNGDGLSLTRDILARRYVPIIILSAQVSPEEQQLIFDALNIGAFDVVPKSRFFSSEARMDGARKLSNLVWLASQKSQRLPPSPAPSVTVPKPPAKRKREVLKAVLIGASTGGTNALRQILEHVPASFPLPILVAQHMGPGFMEGFVHWLSSELKVSVELAKNGAFANSGTVYLPPSDHDLQINSAMQLIVKPSSRRSYTPCVDTLFSSGVRSFGPDAAYVLLTGMGTDGAEALAAAKKYDAITAVQNEESCVVFGMPREALRLCASHSVYSLDELGPWIASLSV